MKKLMVALLMGLSLVGGASAMEAVKPPKGYVLYCLSNLESCAASDVETVEFSDELFDTLKSVNVRWNAAIRYTSEEADSWNIVAAYGDCEDYLLTKKNDLSAVVPPGALRAAITKVRGQWHAILIVKTTAGDFVLDNLSNEVLKVSETGYVIEGISSGKNPLLWTTY